MKLSEVTLIALGHSKYQKAHQRALDLSSSEIEFGAIKNVSDDSLDTLDKYSQAILYDLWKHVDTKFALVIQADGYVLRPHLWTGEFLNYDYIGAPWPLPTDDISYRDGRGDIVRVGNGGFSLRSKKLLRALVDLNLPFTDKGTGYFNEDGVLCCYYRNELEDYGIKFAPIKLAARFSTELTIPETVESFGGHRYL